MSKIPEILRVARTGKYKNMRCIADAVGVSRERVRQVLNEHKEFDTFGRRAGFRLEWLCPDCAVLISRTRSEDRNSLHMPAHCRKCAANYCLREHNLNVVGRWGKHCKVCKRASQQEIVETRTCLECGTELHLTRNAVATIKAQSKSKGKYHRACYNEVLRRERTP